MFTSSENLPADSRIWIYQSNRRFTVEEEREISEAAKSFIETWTAHNKELKASFEIRHHIFLIIMIDERHTSASGCSIDKAFNFIQNMEKRFSVSLLDRNIFALKENDAISLIRRKDFKSMIDAGEISGDTIVFNNLIQTKEELDSKWLVPVKNSWHGAIH